MPINVTNFILPLRIAQLVFAIIVLGTSAYWVDKVSNSDEGAYMVFLPIWTFIALGYLVAVPLFLANLHNEWAVLAVEIVTTILWLAGFAAFASAIDGLECYGDSCKILDSAKAAIAFGALEWVLFCITLGLVIWGIVQSRKTANDVEAGTASEQPQQYGMYEQQPGEFQQPQQPQQAQQPYAQQPAYPTQ